MKATRSKTPDLTVRLSTKGQLVVPKEIRERHGWSSGAELVFEDQADRVILRRAEDLPLTRVEDLIGCTGYKGPRKSLEEMDRGIAEGARRSR
jgi:AbrB family looped-hinge helix DNA binding protein